MTVHDTDDRLAQLEARLEEEVVRLRAANFELEGRMRVQEEQLTARRRDAAAPRMSRGQFLRMGGAAAAGAVAAGASGLLSARPAAAITGQPLLIGQSNVPTTPNDTTLLVDQGTTQLSPTLFWANNTTNAGVTLPLATRIAAAGTTSGPDSSLQRKVGLWGQTDDAANNGAGVVGRAGTTGIDPLSLGGPNGVTGSALDNGNGVKGAANGPAGVGVYGVSDAGYGVIGYSTSGIDLYAFGGGRLLQVLRATAGAPTSGSFLAGEQVRDLNGELWLCVATGSPGTWRRAAAVKQGFQGGSVNMLAKPIRIYDSRSGPPLAAGATVDVQVTGVVVGGVSVPAGAVAVLGNVAVTQTQAPNGYLTLYPQGSPPSPPTANINWFGANQDLNTSVVAALNPANGKLTIHNGMAGGSAPTHVVLDAAAFVI